MSPPIRTNGPSSAAVSITLSGTALGGDIFMTAGSRVGGSGGDNSFWVSSSAVYVKVSAGSRSAVPATVTLLRPAALAVSFRPASTLTLTFTFDTAFVSATQLSLNSAATAGQQVTLSAVQLSSSRTTNLRIGGSSTEFARWVSDTSVVSKKATAAGGTALTIGEFYQFEPPLFVNLVHFFSLYFRFDVSSSSDRDSKIGLKRLHSRHPSHFQHLSKQWAYNRRSSCQSGWEKFWRRCGVRASVHPGYRCPTLSLDI